MSEKSAEAGKVASCLTSRTVPDPVVYIDAPDGDHFGSLAKKIFNFAGMLWVVVMMGGLFAVWLPAVLLTWLLSGLLGLNLSTVELNEHARAAWAVLLPLSGIWVAVGFYIVFVKFDQLSLYRHVHGYSLWSINRQLRRYQSELGHKSDLAGSPHSARIVFLRAFRDDDQTVEEIGAMSELSDVGFEDRLAGQIELYAPMIAVAEPGTKRRGGAARVVLRDDEWPSEVTRWMDDALLILLVPGWSKGIRWELQTAIACGHAAKLVLAFPPDDPHRDARCVTIRDAFQGTPWAAAVQSADFATALVVHPMVGGRLVVIQENPPVREEELRGAIHIAIFGAGLLPALSSTGG